MSEDISMIIRKCEFELSATKMDEDTFDDNTPWKEYGSIIPDMEKRVLAETTLKEIINKNPKYRRNARNALEWGLAEREHIDSAPEMSLGCMTALYGGAIVGSLAIYGVYQICELIFS